MTAPAVSSLLTIIAMPAAAAAAPAVALPGDASVTPDFAAALAGLLVTPATEPVPAEALKKAAVGGKSLPDRGGRKPATPGDVATVIEGLGAAVPAMIPGEPADTAPTGHIGENDEPERDRSLDWLVPPPIAPATAATAAPTLSVTTLNQSSPTPPAAVDGAAIAAPPSPVAVVATPDGSTLPAMPVAPVAVSNDAVPTTAAAAVTLPGHTPLTPALAPVLPVAGHGVAAPTISPAVASPVPPIAAPATAGIATPPVQPPAAAVSPPATVAIIAPLAAPAVASRSAVGEAIVAASATTISTAAAPAIVPLGVAIVAPVAAPVAVVSGVVASTPAVTPTPTPVPDASRGVRIDAAVAASATVVPLPPVAPLVPPLVASAALRASDAFAVALSRGPRFDPRIAGDDAMPGATLATVAPATPATIAVAAAADVQRQGMDLTRDPGLHQMIDRIEQLRDAADARDTRVRLIPDALGPVDISVRRDGDSVRVHFTAERDATRALIADAQPRLTELAEQRGVRIAQASVDAGTDGRARQQQPQAQTATPSAPPRAASEQTDETDARVA